LLFVLTRWGNLVASHWLIKNFITYLIIAIIVLFQGEIRRFLTEIGSRTFRKPFALRSLQEKIEDLFQAVDYLSQKKIGALIAIEKEISLSTYADRGVEVDAVLSKDLLVSIFFPHSPLHDGAVIIKGDKVVAAGCLLPLPAAHRLKSPFQTRTRHLAAIGLSEETDAAVIVISEETGTVSLAIRGQLEKYDFSDVREKRLLGYLRDR
jgi:diadenylate cyclase